MARIQTHILNLTTTIEITITIENTKLENSSIDKEVKKMNKGFNVKRDKHKIQGKETERLKIDILDGIFI
jgi:hypothetical protein